MSKKNKDEDLLTIKVGTAGIGRQFFKAWIVEPGVVDRQDDDEGVYDSPGEALRALADELDRKHSCAAGIC